MNNDTNQQDIRTMRPDISPTPPDPKCAKLNTATDILATLAHYAVSIAIIGGYSLPGSSGWMVLLVSSLFCYAAWRLGRFDEDPPSPWGIGRKLAFSFGGGLYSFALVAIIAPESWMFRALQFG